MAAPGETRRGRQFEGSSRYDGSAAGLIGGLDALGFRLAGGAERDGSRRERGRPDPCAIWLKTITFGGKRGDTRRAR